MIYFAYGSNMSSTVMDERCPGAEPAGAARVGGYRLAFTLPSNRWGGHAADLEACDTSVVWGVRWKISVADLATLDGYEARYDRQTIALSTGTDLTNAVTYTVKAELRAPHSGNPTPQYLQHMLDGAMEHGLPEGYVEYLKSFLEPAA